MSVSNFSNIILDGNEQNLFQNHTDSQGDVEKIVAMGVLGVGSFISGMLPACISERNQRRFPLTTSVLLCFGAGILLATALIHILPEVRAELKSNLAEVALCGGFFIIYFIDEFIHYFFGEAIQHHHAPANVNGSRQTSYGTHDERTPLITEANHDHASDHNHGPTCDDNVVADANARICHTSHTEPCAQSMTGTLGLFVALSLHSAIEGIAIGVQNTAAKVFFLLGAVACHKYVMGFCLGLEIRSNSQYNFKSQIICISVFALGAVAGILVGMVIVDIPSNWVASALPVIQALAGGTLFYVTVCEVIPREKARWHQNVQRKAAGFLQFFAVILGFAAMTLINTYIKDDDN